MTRNLLGVEHAPKVLETLRKDDVDGQCLGLEDFDGVDRRFCAFDDCFRCLVHKNWPQIQICQLGIFLQSFARSIVSEQRGLFDLYQKLIVTIGSLRK